MAKIRAHPRVRPQVFWPLILLVSHERKLSGALTTTPSINFRMDFDFDLAPRGLVVPVCPGASLTYYHEVLDLSQRQTVIIRGHMA
jgi:hypothetical protein